MTFSASEFADDTAFERLVLDRLGTHRIRAPEPGAGVVFDRRGEGPGAVIMKVGTAQMGTGLRDDLQRSLRPLGFAAAYKVLDLLIENVLRANGATARRLTFAKKVRAVSRRPATLPAPLDTRPELWDRLANLYSALEDARHAVTHGRAEPSSTGDLAFYNDRRQLAGTVTSAEITSFAAAVHGVTELVLGEGDIARRASILSWHLNALQQRHGLPPLAATDPATGLRLLEIDLIDIGDGQLRLDIAKARETIDQQGPSLWDIRLHAGGRVFFCHWEDVPDQSAAALGFYPATPPGWLSEGIPMGAD